MFILLYIPLVLNSNEFKSYDDVHLRRIPFKTQSVKKVINISNFFNFMGIMHLNRDKI